ncbi:SRPBCC family protein [Brevibacillus panacihumi]|uniref:SRPBCC family protein n=1 Tax=Brevibacillus panacihumi TaxID=497735 RepID=UPI003D08B7EA
MLQRKQRVFDAPREFVFKLFKEPEYLKRWWGTHGWELPVCNIDFRPGGVWHYCMKCVDQNQEEYGMESWNKTIYKEIVEPEKIVYTDYFSDKDGNINEAMPAPEVTMEFIDLGAGSIFLVCPLYNGKVVVTCSLKNNCWTTTAVLFYFL